MDGIHDRFNLINPIFMYSGIIMIARIAICVPCAISSTRIVTISHPSNLQSMVKLNIANSRVCWGIDVDVSDYQISLSFSVGLWPVCLHLVPGNLNGLGI